MNCVLIKKKTILEDKQTLYPGEVYLVKDYLKANTDTFMSFTFNDFIKKLSGDNISNKSNSILIFRGGGIGDLIALSSICEYYKDSNIYFFTQKKYFPLFSWFNTAVTPLNIYGPLLKDFSFKNQITKFKHYRSFIGEGLIETGDRRNWYKLMYNYAGLDKIHHSHFRPSLKGTSTKESECRYILIMNKANVMHRSIEFSTIFNALFPFLRDYHQVFVYADHLSDNDRDYLKNLDYKSRSLIDILQAENLDEFLWTVNDANLVISVDTSALHFREGIKKPAIGLYSSFTTESRTKYYKYTKSYDIKSECKHQPCFLHPKTNLEFCPACSSHQFAPPCVSNQTNKTLHNQLLNIFEINKNLI